MLQLRGRIGPGPIFRSLSSSDAKRRGLFSSATSSSPFSPFSLLAWGLENVHQYTGLPWVGTIALTALTTRLLIFPLTVSQLRFTISSKKHKAFIEARQHHIHSLRLAGSHEKAKSELVELNSFMRRNNCHPIQMLSGFIPIPIYMCMFITIRDMSAQPLSTLCSESFLWLASISDKDPTYAIPILTSVTLLGSLQVPHPSHRIKGELREQHHCAALC